MPLTLQTVFYKIVLTRSSGARRTYPILEAQ